MREDNSKANLVDIQNQYDKARSLSITNSEIDDINNEFDWDPSTETFQNNYKRRFFLSIFLFTLIFFGHIGIFAYIYINVIKDDSQIISICNNIENIYLYNSLCAGSSGSGDRVWVVFCYWYIMVFTWVFMLLEVDIKNERLKTLQNHVIKISYLARLLALYCYASYSSSYDYPNNKIIYQYSEADNTLYYGLIGVSYGLSLWIVSYLLLVTIIPSKDPIIFPKTSRVFFVRGFLSFAFMPIVFVTLYYLYLTNFNEVTILDVFKPRGPNLISITILTYYQVFSCVIEYTIILPVALFIRSRTTTRKFQDKLSVIRKKYLDKYPDEMLLKNVFLNPDFHIFK